MIFALLSARLRSWLMFALVLPLFGRLLEALGVRVARRNPRAGRVMQQAASYTRRPSRRQRRY